MINFFPSLTLLTITFSMATSSIAFAKCSIVEGEQVTLEDPKKIFSRFSNLSIEAKGEFETTAAYEQRMGSANFDGQPILLKSSWDDDEVSYDADREVFLIKHRAWSGYLVDSHYENMKFEKKDYFYKDKIGVHLKTDRVMGKTYVAGNALGQTVNVQVVNRNSYAVFESVSEESIEQWKGELWTPDNPDSYMVRLVPAIEIHVPIEKAKALKSNFQAGIYFVPKRPYITEGNGYKKPVIANPEEHFTEHKTLIGNIICAVITDDNGIVLKTVDKETSPLRWKK